MQDIIKFSLAELIDRREEGEISPREITEVYRERLEELDGKIGAFVDLNDEITPAGEGELAGIPVALKDNMATSNLSTGCASEILEDYQPPYDAAVVEKLKEAGAFLIGKTNMDEFAMGSTTEFSAQKVTRNPWNLDHVPGGSSGGSAAAVAAGFVPAALGSDTGGSIRQPAAFSGVVGLKPTYGLVSRYGLIAFASSLDQIGPLARNVEDAAILLNIISGHDKRDSTSADIDHPDYLKNLDRGVSNFTFGLPEGYLDLDIDNDVKQAVRDSIKALEKAGAEVIEVELPSLDQMLAAYYVIAPAEASSNLARYDGVQYGKRQEAEELEEMYFETRSLGFGPEVKRRIMLGTYALSAGYQDDLYKQALKVRTIIKEAYQEVFEKVDMLLTPTAPTPAFAVGEEQDPLDVYYTDVFTVPCNITGFPGISLPAGFNDEGLPLGVQLISSSFNEVELLQAASGLEKLLDTPSLAKLD
ncbi:Asp-tRNA(Asn)/Glu-tRNA(Gln) amidotransferase subunit GatA [Halarsenatibacter silvermanii]|uniref:Glutamyl-tRNA(Gln) amidotransferase subunit A n=1 Tax=Halarsenatibacter silvermanii TaxID=321763 RepID=A0A1G9NHB1_9FIRM|nr:Asp-tRNA(Asn)/Glu-tRNA(Gln) amidotransferase subunit GatA [Halarsenatibacter silvermanii]SDL85740.1 aspartyl/glutamyl-tRNA(Asn/Gln) amidotransferase subunit A [Halarsenatibacter silvermanii]